MILKTYPHKESKTLEFKESIPTKNQLIKTCIAFANGMGGEIVIGIENQTQKILGISDKERDRIFDGFNNSIFDSITPTIIPDIYEKNIDGKTLVFIRIYPGNKPPYFIKSEGSRQGVYLRVGTSTRKASDDYIEDLYRHQKKTYFDEESSGQDMNVLDPALLKQVYGKQHTLNQLLADKVVISNIQNPKKTHPTNAGILFFTDNPDQYISESIIICTQFKGIKGRDIIRTTELKGPIQTLATSSFKLITSWLEKDLTIQSSGKMEGRYLLPEEAVREGIINSLIHRKYFIPGAVKIALYEDRLEIFSPGSFPGLVTVDSLGDGTTFLRNPTIAKLARKLKLVEKLGSGIRLIFELCKKEKLKRPVFNEDGDFVKLTFYFEKTIEKTIAQTISQENQIILLGKDLVEIKIKDLTQRLGISRNTATRKLNSLIKKNIFERRGKGPATVYRHTGRSKK